MTVTELIERFEKSRRRWHLVGDEDAGVVIGLDLEGRLFAGLDGSVLNRVNPEAFEGFSSQEAYLNPGGDGLWPAPEGSTLGYEYATSSWRVPPGLTSARYVLLETSDDAAAIRAEIDLINARGIGVPTAFERHVAVNRTDGAITVNVTECIEYLGKRPLERAEAMLAPWTLCQFDSGPGCHVRFPDAGRSAVWDLYDPSESQRILEGSAWITRTEGGPRYQIGLAPDIDWLEFTNQQRRLTVRRTAKFPPEGQTFIDIADRPPDVPPDGQPVRLSVYSDPECFMEIEAAGGCPDTLTPGDRLTLDVSTTYALN